MTARRVESFNPEQPQEPKFFVDKLIKIVREMTPRASRYQWNRFAITARNIELSHDFFITAAELGSEPANKDVKKTKDKKKEKQVSYEEMSTDDLEALFFKYEREAEDLASKRDEIEANRVKKDRETMIMFQILAKRKQHPRRFNGND